MALIETLTMGVGAAVAKAALKRWLCLGCRHRNCRHPESELTLNKTERDFKWIAEEIAGQLVPFIENEAGDLAENEREAAAFAVADTFERPRFSPSTFPGAMA